ncbi:MAG: hydratase [Beijerinckiaceae bacterium]
MSFDLAALAKRLHDARASARAVEIDAGDIGSISRAYAIQSELIRLAGGNLEGWKVTALTPNDQQQFGGDRAVAGAVLREFVYPSGSQLKLSSFIAPLIECEIAFMLGADLPARSHPYLRSEVEAAISAVVPVFEFPDSRVGPSAGDLVKLADVMSNGALVVGEPVADGRGLDLTRTGGRLELDRRIAGEGTTARILGDPIRALLALANACPLPSPLRAGQIVTTGTCTDPIPVQPGYYVASFSGLRDVEVHFTA